VKCVRKIDTTQNNERGEGIIQGITLAMIANKKYLFQSCFDFP